jgi:lipopolysaccharide/colanic/teichoic acid biosynthesis glycosyltransferase
MKRGFDILFSLALIIVALPVITAIWLAIRVLAPGPALFRQKRIGQSGQEFEILKFRTMVVNAEALGGFSTEAGDPRITRIGAFLRRTSLDEIPQLANVLRGDMSIVGPRPDVPGQRALYSAEDWRLRHLVRPGITGLAQATLRSEATPEERLALDLDYVRDHGLARDIAILTKTLVQIVTKGGN